MKEIVAPNQPGGNNLRIVNRVVDSLDVRVSRSVYPASWLLEAVEDWRKVRERWHEDPHAEPPVVELPGLGSFTVLPDSRPFEFVLVNPEIGDIRVWNPNKWSKAVTGQTGQLYVSFRSGFLQQLGTMEALEYLRRVADLFIGGEPMPPQVLGFESYPDFERVSRIDLAVDVQTNGPFRWADLDAFVCQAKRRQGETTPYVGELRKVAKKLVERLEGAPPPLDNKGGAFSMLPSVVASEAFREFAHHVIKEKPLEGEARVTSVIAGRSPQTIYFGGFKSKLYGRVYNKLLSLPVQDKLYMLDVWAANGYDGASGVWRVEFSLSGDALREMQPGAAFHGEWGEDCGDLRELVPCLNHLEKLWGYLTRKWLRHTVPNNDRKVSRWENSELWDLVAGAWGDVSAAYRAPLVKNPDPDQLYKQAIGVIGSYCAKVASSDFNPDALDGFIHSLLLWRETPDFYAAQLGKRQRFGVDDMSDVALSSRYRAERMLAGRGS